MTAEVTKITKSIQFDLSFNFIELLEVVNSFVKICVVLEIKSIASFINEETFHARNEHKLAIVVFNQLRRFQNKNL